MSNAIEFSPLDSTVSISVETIEDLTDTTRPSRRIQFAIKDCGRGIPADKIETIFNRFQQVDASDSRDQGGTG